MIISVKVKKGQRPTDEQIREIEKAARRPIVADEDAPEYDYEQLVRYREAAKKKRNEETVTVSLSEDSYRKAKEFGSDYRKILSRLIELALGDKEMVKKASAR